MDNICVKIKQREKDKYRKLLTINGNLYASLAISADLVSTYTPGALLEEGAWFCIQEISKKEFCIDVLTSDYSSVDFRTLERNDFTKVDFLFVLTENHIAFQNISKTKLLSKRRIFALGEGYQYQDDCNEIVINDIPDAIYDKVNDVLYFRRLESITSIFRGIDQLYREATDEETTQFLSNEFINLKNGYSTASVKTANRKRIALAMKTLNALNDNDKKNIFAYIGDYCPELKVTEDSFEVGTEEDMKKLLFGIEQRFYTTPVGGEKRIANSVIPLN